MTVERWLEVCRAMRDGVAAAVAGVPRARRADELGRGAGGDLTVAVDQAAEDAALAVLAAVAGEGEGSPPSPRRPASAATAAVAAGAS